MVEGRGPAQVVEYAVEFEGTLHVWTSSELDLYLRIDDIASMEVLGEDDDSGGGDTPYLRLDVNRGDRLAVFVSGPVGRVGGLLLHLIAAPETGLTREVGAAAPQGVEAVLVELQSGSAAIIGPDATTFSSLQALIYDSLLPLPGNAIGWGGCPSLKFVRARQRPRPKTGRTRGRSPGS